MGKYNIVFVDTAHSNDCLLGRRARDFVLREFADFKCDNARIVKESLLKDACTLNADDVLVVLALDMPLVRKDDVLKMVSFMQANGISKVKLGSASYISIGDGKESGVFSKDGCFLSIDSAKSFNVVYNKLKERIIDGFLQEGVVIVDSASTFIDDTVQIERGAKILPFCRIEGASVIMKDATVSASYLNNCVIEDGANVESTHAVCSRIGKQSQVGPFARLRHATVDSGCRVGDFVEIKASRLHDGVKASHLCYIGDADVGERTNVGCGTVFCNYDGEKKNKTTVGSECFIGANTNLIAPIVIGDNAFIAAGTTVTRDVQESSFTIGRVKQDTKIKK